MKNKLLTLIIGLVIGACGFNLVNSHNLKMNSKFDVNLLAGEYSVVSDYDTVLVRITELLKPATRTNQREFRASFSTVTSSGCTGGFIGYGKPNKDSISFETLNGDTCKITAKPIDGLKYIEINAEGKDCSRFSGMNCGFYGKLQREGKFYYFPELESLAKEHPTKILALASVGKGLTEIMGADYNDLYDRMIAAEKGKGTFDEYENTYCANGVMSGLASDNKATFCLNYENGSVQAAVMVDGKTKYYHKGKMFSKIAHFPDD